jgi:hypothetical protein
LWLWSAVWTKGMERSEVRTRVGTWERRLRGDGTGREGTGQGCFSGVLVLEGRFRASALSKWTPLCIRFFIGKAKTPAIARSHTD